MQIGIIFFVTKIPVFGFFWANMPSTALKRFPQIMGLFYHTNWKCAAQFFNNRLIDDCFRWCLRKQTCTTLILLMFRMGCYLFVNDKVVKCMLFWNLNHTEYTIKLASCTSWDGIVFRFSVALSQTYTSKYRQEETNCHLLYTVHSLRLLYNNAEYLVRSNYRWRQRYL